MHPMTSKPLNLGPNNDVVPSCYQKKKKKNLVQKQLTGAIELHKLKVFLGTIFSFLVLFPKLESRVNEYKLYVISIIDQN